MSETPPRRQTAHTPLRQLRAIGHKLNPVVTVAGAGLTENVLAEVDRALADHELIKVKVAAGDRETRDSVIAALVEASGAELIQRTGNIALILRRTAEPDPRKSNLLRVLG
jgi:RNA-binding protein